MTKKTGLSILILLILVVITIGCKGNPNVPEPPVPGVDPNAAFKAFVNKGTFHVVVAQVENLFLANPLDISMTCAVNGDQVVLASDHFLRFEIGQKIGDTTPFTIWLKDFVVKEHKDQHAGFSWKYGRFDGYFVDKGNNVYEIPKGYLLLGNNESTVDGLGEGNTVTFTPASSTKTETN